MIYEYKCVNLECSKRNKPLEINLPMAEASCTQYCEECKEALQKVFGIQGHSTFSDGYKG